jgi:4-amino-4-deoxy-L-arabinose transferase-like glycosyltransferase
MSDTPRPPALERRVPWRRDLVGWSIFVLALLVRVAVVLDFEAHHPLAERPVIDEASYERWALRIAGGDWLGDEVFFQEPLYSYWLGVVYWLAGPERTVVRLLQAAIGAASCVLVATLGRRAFGPLAGAVAGFALAVHPPHVFLACLLLKENLFVFLWTGLAVLVVGRASGRRADDREPGTGAQLGRGLAIGLLGGLGALLRGNALVLLPALLLWPFVARRLAWPYAPRAAWRTALAIAFGIAAVLGPTALRNWYVGGAFVLTTSGAGTNFYGGNNADNPYGRATEFDWVRGIPEHEAGDWARAAARRTGRDLRPDEVSDHWMGEVWRSVRADPALHASILWNKARLTLGPYEVPDNHSLDWDARYVATLRFLPAGHRLWGWLGLAGLVAFPLCVRRARAGWPLAALWLGYFLTVVLTVTSMRARLPLVVWAMPFAGAYVTEWLRQERRVGSLVVAGAAAGLVAWLPTLSPAERQEDLDGRDFNHAIYLLRADDEAARDAARAIATDLESRHPQSARVKTLVASIDAGVAFERRAANTPEGRREAQVLLGGALERLQEVLNDPRTNARERFRANAVSGHVLLRNGSVDQAVPRLRAALEFDPTDADVRLALADALVLRARDARTGPFEKRALAEEAAGLLERLRAESDEAARRAVDARLALVREMLAP